MSGDHEKMEVDKPLADEDDVSSSSERHTPESTTTNEFTVSSTLAVAGGFFSTFCTAGFANSFGILQEYYSTHQLADKSAFQIIWLPAFQSFALFAFAPLSGTLTDRIGPFLPLTVGAVLLLLSVFMVSLCKEYYQFFLAQGLLMGLAMSFVTIPAVATVSKRFAKRGGLAMGIVISGSSIGGVVWPIEAEQLLYAHHLSFGWTLRILGFTMLPILVSVPLFVRLPPKEYISSTNKNTAQIEKGGPEARTTEEEPQVAKKKTDLSILKKPAFWLLCAGVSTLFLGFWTPIFLITTYSVEKGLTPSFAFYMTSITMAGSFFGRVAPGFYADKYGPFNILVLSAGASASVAFCWTAATSTAGIIVWVLAYGFASGSFLSLQATCAGKISTPETRGMAIGLIMGGGAITGLFGPPISGAIEPHGYMPVSMFVGAILVLGTILVAGARLALEKRLWTVV